MLRSILPPESFTLEAKVIGQVFALHSLLLNGLRFILINHTKVLVGTVNTTFCFQPGKFFYYHPSRLLFDILTVVHLCKLLDSRHRKRFRRSSCRFQFQSSLYLGRSIFAKVWVVLTFDRLVAFHFKICNTNIAPSISRSRERNNFLERA